MVDSHGSIKWWIPMVLCLWTWTPHGQKISHGHGQVHLKEVTSSTAATKKGLDASAAFQYTPNVFNIGSIGLYGMISYVRFCGKVLTFYLYAL
jgi:hypothetical protein